MSPALNTGLDDDEVAVSLAAHGRVRVHSFLHHDHARNLASELEASSAWRHVLNAGDGVFEMSDADHRQMAPEQARTLEALTYRSAAGRFQYRYDTIRIADRTVDPAFSDCALGRFAALLNSPAILDRMRGWTGEPDLAFADCQSTRYQPGDFLTRHNDDVDGKHRRFAYVLSLSDDWDADWGGLLLFHDSHGVLQEAWSPAFNCLSLFAVGQPHSVSMVAPFAPRPRLSLTGWLRCEAV